MVSWRVTSTNPNSGTVEDFGGGSFKFPQNSTTSSIVYTVEYTDNAGNTSTSTYTVYSGSTCQPVKNVYLRISGLAEESSAGREDFCLIDNISDSDLKNNWYGGSCRVAPEGYSLTDNVFELLIGSIDSNNNFTSSTYVFINSCSGGNYQSNAIGDYIGGSVIKFYAAASVDPHDGVSPNYAGSFTMPSISYSDSSGDNHIYKDVTLVKDITACTCNNFSASTYSVGFGSDSGTTAVNWSHPATCSGDVSGTSDQNWCTVTSENGEFTIKVDKYEYQSGAQTRTAYITPTMNGSSCTDKKIEVTQTPPSPVACTCDDFRVGSSPAAIPATGGSAVVTWEFTGSCTSVLVAPSVPSEATWCHVTTGNGVFNITVDNYPYSSGVTDRSATITPLLGESRVACTSRVFTVTQLAPTLVCTCDNFSILSSRDFPSSGGTSGAIGSWNGCRPDVASKPDWVTVRFENGNSIWVDATENTSSDSREGFVVFSYNGVLCENKKLKVTQQAPAPVCTCNDFTLTGVTNITSSSQSTAVIGTYTLPSCTGSITSYTSDVDWVSNLSCINGTVYGRVTENTSTSSRSGTLSLEWTGGGLTCNKATTFTQKGGTPPSTCELIVSNGEGPGTYLPCEGGTVVGWICNYEVITTTEGVTSKTAEGSATGEFEVTDNCNGVQRELNIENQASSDLILNSLIDDETGEDLLMTYSSCLLSGTFTQEGAAAPPTHITSCNDLKWDDDNGHFINISNSSYTYDGKKAGATFSIHPTFNGNWVKCKKCQIIQFYADVKTPEYFPQGAPGCDTHYSWEHNWAVLCDGQYACGTTGGTSGDTKIYSNGASGWGKIVNAMASEYGGLQPVESTYANLSLSTSYNSFSADFTCSWSYGQSTGLLYPECQDITDVLQFDVIVEFEVYKDQSKEQYQYTDSDETITCSFGFNVKLFRRYE